MLLKDHAIEWLFVIAPLLSNISALTSKHEPRKLSFQWQWQSAYPPRSPISSYRNGILHGGWFCGDISSVCISSKSIKRFHSCRGSKFALSYWLGHWLIQNLNLAANLRK